MAIEKSRTFLGVLYPDSESYDCASVLERLADVFEEWAYITHDMDTDENGEVKKPHIHWVGKLANAALLSTVAGGHKLGVPENSVEYCRSWKAAVRYLVHKDSPEKFQYSTDLVHSNFEIGPVLDRAQCEIVKVKMIRQYILDTQCTSATQLLDWCIENNCWSEYRRSFAIWSCIMREVKEVYDGSYR